MIIITGKQRRHHMSDFFYTVFPTVLSLLLFGIISVLAYNHETTLLVYRAIFKAFPFFKKLEKEYGALYTTYISYITSSERTLFDDPRVFDDLYLFIADFAIHVICRFDSSQHIVIPFDSILYQEHRISNFFARLRHNARYTYAYHFTLGVLYNGSMEKISFCTNYYNHRIDRLFNNRLDSMGLYEYISNRFPDSEESGF